MTPHDDNTPELNLLREELHKLALRVDALEHHTVLQTESAAPALPVSPDFAMPDAIPILGKAVLALAGAYVLRAIAESSPVPGLIVVVFAIGYAMAWLVFAQRSAKTNALAGATYGLTAALILSPLLWEATVRFHVLPGMVAAGVLVVFAAISAGAPITTVSSVLTALALMIGTGDLAPYAMALLAIAAMSQTRGRIRVPAIVAAALGVCVVLFIVTRPAGIPENYRPVAPAVSITLCGLLLLISTAGIAWRTVWQRGLVSAFEIAQAIVVFFIAAGGTLQIAHGRAAAAVGALSALACAACYFTAFLRFPESPRRNHHVFAAWGAALGILACFLILPDSWLTPIWSAAAVVATLTRARTLAFHGAMFLLASAIASGVPPSLFNAFTSTDFTPLTPALWIFTLAALACCAASFRTPLGTVYALIAAPSLAMLLILLAKPSAAFLPAARTLVTSALALAFALAGSRTGRRELTRIAYAIVALGSIKLLVVDFRQNHPAVLSVSLLCYGGLLLLMPRLSAQSE